MHQAPLRSDAVWPWPGAEQTAPHKGVTRWFISEADKTELELLRFDFKDNPHLRFELYDQDQDDDKPFDDNADYAKRGVGMIVDHLNKTKGHVVAAWNGLFFSYNGAGSKGSHIGPVVIDGRPHYNVGIYRWAFGVRYRHDRPEFVVLHKPDIRAMAREIDFGAMGAQCLIRNGLPLHLQPLQATEDSNRRTAGDTENDAGHIARVDYIRTSRTSMAWSKDNRYLYLLVVNAPETETESWLVLENGLSPEGGWALRDLQNFWLSLGAWGAVNSDGGILTQLAYELPDGRYALLPSRLNSPNKRLILDKYLTGAPAGGSLMTFYVRDDKK